MCQQYHNRSLDIYTCSMYICCVNTHSRAVATGTGRGARHHGYIYRLPGVWLCAAPVVHMFSVAVLCMNECADVSSVYV